MLFFSTDSSQNLKSGKVNCTVIILCYVCKTKFSSTIKNLLFLLRKQKKTHSSAGDSWEYTSSYFKENGRAKNSTAQENISISRLTKRL